MVAIHKGNRAQKTLAKSSIRKKAEKFSENLFVSSKASVPQYISNANRLYAIADNNRKFRGFATVVKKPNALSLELIAVNTNRTKRIPGQRGWGTRLMNEIKNNAKKMGFKRVIVHNPVWNAKNFYKKLGYNNISMTSGGTNRMARNLSPNVTSKRRNSPSASKG